MTHQAAACAVLHMQAHYNVVPQQCTSVGAVEEEDIIVWTCLTHTAIGRTGHSTSRVMPPASLLVTTDAITPTSASLSPVQQSCYLIIKLGQLRLEPFQPHGLSEVGIGTSEQLKHAVSPFQQVLQCVVLQRGVGRDP